jgi:hypothetical protein
METFLFTKQSTPINDNLSNDIDQAHHNKIPDSATLGDISTKILESNRSINEKVILLKKLFQV